MKNVIITGATGMLGISLIEALIFRGIKVTALIHPNSARKDAIPKNPLVTIIECDFNQLNKLQLSDKYDVFFHFAWKDTTHKGRSNPVAQQENISLTLQSVQLAHRLGCSCFVGAGSQAEYGRVSNIITPETSINPDSAYGISKYAAGTLGAILAKELKIRYIWARVFSVYGPHDGAQTMISNCIRKLKNNEEMELTSCEQLWDYLYEEDCAKAFIAIAEKGKDQSVYCIGSGKARPLKEYVFAIANMLGNEYLLKIGAKSYNENQIMHLQADITSLTKDTGFIPSISFEDSLKLFPNLFN
ncbi:MAG: NAD-dependent epimerase/dehydratase family protein [Brevinema sp.]